MLIHLQALRSSSEERLIIVHRLHVLQELLVVHVSMAVTHVLLLFLYIVLSKLHGTLSYTDAVVELHLHIVKIILFILHRGDLVSFQILIFCHLICLSLFYLYALYTAPTAMNGLAANSSVGSHPHIIIFS